VPNTKLRQDISKSWLGRNEENRKSYRRNTIASVSFTEHFQSVQPAIGTNISKDGLYVRLAEPLHVGSRVQFWLKLPYSFYKPLRIKGKVVRKDEIGMGVLFEELHSKDRSFLRDYSGFVDLDDAVVRLQNSLAGVLAGNLLPVSEWPLIEERLTKADEKNLNVLLTLSTKSTKTISARLRYGQKQLRLTDLDRPLPLETQVIYCILTDGPLQAVFEGIIQSPGEEPTLLLPERMYHNERRWSRRFLEQKAELLIPAPHLREGTISLPIADISEGGCSVLVPAGSLLTAGMKMPHLELRRWNGVETFSGATIVRLIPQENTDQCLVGLNFSNNGQDRNVFSEIEEKSVRSSSKVSLLRLATLTKNKIRGFLTGKQTGPREKVCLVQYKNTVGHKVVSILDASFDLQDEPPEVDVAVVIGQPFQVRKEVFGLLARTLVDNFKALKINGVVCRFDLTHTVGESEVDPELEAKGCPYLNWTYSQYESDLHGSLKYLERRFSPKYRVLLTYSVAAIPARRLLADGLEPKADLWIAPFGCPDGQDMFKNLLAGVDLFQYYLRGEKAEPFLIYGRLADPNGVMPDAMRRGMAFLEDARKDMEKITVPVTWILGTYDYMVTRQRVRQMLNAPGGGVREIIELEAGHFLKSGPEAIESYKLIAENLVKHLFRIHKPPVEPDLGTYARQTEAEWGRIKRLSIQNREAFWTNHLFGTSSEMEGYDVLLYNPEYVTFMEEQAKELDVQPGMHMADIGCGTGNLTLATLRNIKFNGDPLNLTCYDFVPEALQRTREKIEKFISTSNNGSYSGLRLNYQIVDLETARLTPLKEFLSGQLYGPLALAGRIEGLSTATLRKVAEGYGARSHQILQGEDASENDIMNLFENLDQEEAETIRDISRASRFLKNMTVQEDLKPDKTVAETANELLLKYVNFGQANRDCRVDLPSNTFNRVGVSLVLPYLYDPRSVLKELYRILTPGGKVVLSGLKPNFDSSKSYLEEADEIRRRTDLPEEKKKQLLASLVEFSSFIASLIELEDNGRFKFFSTAEWVDMMTEAGFDRIKTKASLGSPPTGIIVSAEKKL